MGYAAPSSGSVLPILAHNTPPAATGDRSRVDLQRILRLQVPVIVKLAERKQNLSEVLRLQAGSIIEFAKNSDEPLELMINNKAVAVGDAVKVGENFGLRIRRVGDLSTIIQSLRGT